MKHTVDNRAIIQPRTGLVPLRDKSGKLYGYLDPESRIIEFKAQRGGNKTQARDVETVDLKPHLK